MDKIIEKRFKVIRVVYYNEQSKWGVLGVQPLNPLDPQLELELSNKFNNISISGSIQGVYEGAEVEVTGDIVDDPRYGKQIHAKSVIILQDLKTKEGIINFLTRSTIEGISTQNAKKIYNKFKQDSIKIVLEDPYKLEEIYGIGHKTAKKVAKSVAIYKQYQALIEFCTNLGLSYTITNKLRDEFGTKALEIIQTDPYKILDISQNLTFSQVDEIYLKSGGNPTNPKRLEMALLHTLKRLCILSGSTGCPSSTLEKNFYKVLKLTNKEDRMYEKEVYKLIEKEKIDVSGEFTETSNIYFKEFTDIELSIASKISTLNDLGNPYKKIDEKIVKEEINNFPFTLNKGQITAVKGLTQERVGVLTAAAGCGKSTITKALYNIFTRSGLTVSLVAPTSKAARRLEECIGGGVEAQTIHRYLGIGIDGITAYLDNVVKENNVVIVDEASMVDINLFNLLLQTITPSCRIILVGDNNQLPSVQAGNVLGDLISSLKVRVFVLTDVMRQSENSNIIKFCTMANNGKIFDPCELPDFHYEEFGTAEELRELFLEKYLDEVEKNSLAEVQVITPYKNGEVGMNNLNTLLQRVYNMNGEEVVAPFRIGDRVRHTVNNYKKEVFNGETGIVIAPDEDEREDHEGEIKVDYGDRAVWYNKNMIDELTLAYCSTVHASQGSEYAITFIILDDTAVNDFLFIRRLLYTAMSRGRKKVYILTKPYLVDKCVSNDVYKPRITRLKDYLKASGMFG